jgi:hypothetical protein
MVINVKGPQSIATKRRYGSVRDVHLLTGIAESTLRCDRLTRRERFPSYTVGRRVLYDLDEVERIIADSRREREFPRSVPSRLGLAD